MRHYIRYKQRIRIASTSYFNYTLFLLLIRWISLAFGNKLEAGMFYA